jgi:hypothetical protein
MRVNAFGSLRVLATTGLQRVSSCFFGAPSIAVFSSKRTFVVQSLAVAAMLFVHGTTAKAGVLLDNTSNLTNTSWSTSTSTWGQTTAYSRINGHTIEVGSTSYDATDVTISIQYNRPTSITPNIRIQVWELADLTSTAPAAGASVYYTLNDNTKTFNSTIQYYTYSLNNLNLKANTRYSIGFSTDLTDNAGFFKWNELTPPTVPTGTAGLTSRDNFFSTNGGTSYSTSAAFRKTFQLNGVLAGSGSGSGGGSGSGSGSGGGVAVPEPSSMAIFGLGALGMAYHVRRKSIARRQSKA